MSARVNIFQGNRAIQKAIADALGFEYEKDYWRQGWESREMFFSTFFYMTKRFGMGKVYDEYKDVASWNLEIKGFSVTLYLNSSFLEIMMFGDPRIYGNYSARTPYRVRYWRERERKQDLLVELYSEDESERSKQLCQKLFVDFADKHGINSNTTQEEFNDKFQEKWWEYLEDYNNSIIGVDAQKFQEKYGYVYSNSNTRYALRVLDKCLKNLLAPIWIRDVPYNIKGRLTDKEANYFSRYDGIKSSVLKENES